MPTTINLEQNKFAACPKGSEESWKRTDPEIFFLPEGEILNFEGQSALENKNKLSPWKVCFRDFNDFNSIAGKLENIIGKEGLVTLQQEERRLVLIHISHGLADVYMNENLKSYIEFKSAPWNADSVVKNSPIGAALASRLKTSSPHKIEITLSSRDNEIPLFVVLNHLDPNYAQSYGHLHFLLKKDCKAELMLLEGGSQFSLFRHHLELEENASLTEFWLNNPCSENNKTLYLERLVTLNENSKFKDAQIFVPKANMRITSHIQLNGIKSLSESGGVVIANSGKFDYEPIQQHSAKLSKSKLNLKMILDNKAKAAFQGLVIMQKEAQKCEALQENKNILLSKQTRVDALPRLEILPNDVICKHGSATGEIDKKQLYYLQTRGFRLDQAQNLLLKSFAQSALGFLEEESALQKIVESTLFTVMPA